MREGYIELKRLWAALLKQFGKPLRVGLLESAAMCELMYRSQWLSLEFLAWSQI